MIKELNQALKDYQAKWQKLINERHNQQFFENLRPTAVGWKVKDLADLDRSFTQLRDLCDQIHWGWLNERWLITLHLKSSTLKWNIQVIKLMQRRPSSTDAVGLDHVDLLMPKSADAKAILANEPKLKWTEEKNGDKCKWLSIWFDYEAKLRQDTVIEVCID